MTTTQTQGELVQLDPSVILADDNVRYNLKKMQVERLAEDILAYGGVHTPGEVEPLPEPVDGKTYRLTVGHYRHAAVSLLNERDHAGLQLPVFIRPSEDATARLKRQLSENVERENLSPMDMATAIKKLLAAGVSRLEVRKIFARPTGKKGIAYQPASNAWINMVASFLDLPKAMQEKIHDGRIGIAAAYELTRVSPERRADVLARAEEDRLRALEQEEKDEEKYLKSEQKVAEVKAKADEAVSALETAKQGAAAAAAEVKAKEQALKAAGTVPKDYLQLPKEQQKTFAEALEKAKADLKAAQKAETAATAAVAKLEGKTKEVSAKAAEAAKKLAEARLKAKAKGPKQGAKPVGAKDVQRAAEKEGAQASGKKPLNASEMRAALAEMAIPTYPTVKQICEALLECFMGGPTTLQTMRKLAEIVKEPQRPKEKAAAKKD